MVEQYGAKLSREPIAIVGMSGVFPNAKNMREYWNNILEKIDCIIDVPENRWRIEDYYDPDPTAPDKTYCKRGGFLPEVDFDPLEFGLPPNILEITDVSQLLSLIVAKEALDDAGYLNAADAIRDRTGVILGVGGGQKLITPLTARLQYPIWRKVLLSSGIPEADVEPIVEKMKLAYVRWEENSFPGMLGNVVAGRIANRFDLGGTNSVVDAACASSLSALRYSVSELVEGTADMMLTGGVDTDNSIFMYMCFSKTPAFSKGDEPRPFDEASDGMMVGEGIGMYVLKRLCDAERDHDRIYAVIKGIGTSSDGRYKSIYAPRGEGQERALRRAYEEAELPAASVGLIEAHGTGTVAGDHTEVTTLVRYFNTQTERKQYIALGSVKSQIGHTKATAGAAGMIKAALALYHKVLPAMNNVDTPNPKFALETSPLYINTETRPWLMAEGAGPRRAGVSSFGFGGTNFHVVLEEYQGDHQKPYRLQRVPQAIFLAANNAGALSTLVSSALAGLNGDDAENAFLNLVEQSAAVQPTQQQARLGFVALTLEEARDLLSAAADLLRSKADAEEWQHPKGIFYRKNGLALQGKVVALFSGQGSQYAGMGRELALNFPEARAAFQKIDALFQHDGNQALSEVTFPAPLGDAHKQAQADLLQRTDYSQPAIGVMSASLYQILHKAGFRADFMAGHSFGELSALWASGALSDDDYFRLMHARGKAMAPLADPNFDAGTMLAVTGAVDNLANDLTAFPGVVIANYNSPSQVVVAGPKAAVANAQTGLKAKGYNVIPLAVSAAFHTAQVGHAQKPFAEAISKANVQAPTVPVFSNATGERYQQDANFVRQTLGEHILQPVQFRREVENLYAAGGYLFVEFGPRNILTNLVKETLGSRPHIAVALNGSRQKDGDRQLREAAVQLRVLGIALNDIDPYRQPARPAPKARKGLTVKLTGANYLSDKTRATFEEALQNGHKISLTAAAPAVSAPVVPAPAPIAETPAAPVQDTLIMTQTPVSAQSLDNALEHFLAQQQETLHVHQQYLANQAEYLKSYFHLMQQQQALLASQSISAEIAAQLARSLMLFQDHQTETLRIHEQYLNGQAQAMNALVEMAKQGGGSPAPVRIPLPNPVQPLAAALVVVPPVPPVAPPPAPVVAPVQPPAPVVASVPAPVAPVAPPAPVAPAQVAAPVNTEAFATLSKALLGIVSEKTGYPSEMIDLNMDIEADLGIDSIKRVEILGAMREQFPELPQLKPEELAELRTLAQIVDYMKGYLGGASAPAAAPAPVSAPVQPVAAPVVASTPAPVAPATPAPAPVANDSGAVAMLSTALLGIVSEKTGYPSEMLDLNMDIEADLGIDSIKRVEILGAMREQFPELPQLKPEELAELRTLAQIVDYMKSHVNGGSAPAAAPAPVSVPAQPVAALVVASAPAPAAPAPAAPAPVVAAPVADGSGAVAMLSTALLGIVSEKTGYPSEMLDLNMDIEADLGIDSIKRVEILGAMREQFPELPQLKPEELAELRTLAQIVDYMKGHVNGGEAAAVVASVPPQPEVTPGEYNGPVTPVPVVPAAPVTNTSSVDEAGAVAMLSTALLGIVSEKTGYPSEMLDLNMDIEADLGIDSIKRVEILGAMREQFPELPQLKPEELAELRTLAQIVDYMKAHVGGGAVSNGANGHVSGGSDNGHFFPVYEIPRQAVRVKTVPAPDRMEFNLPQGFSAIVTDDGSALTGQLAEALSGRGWQVAVLALPGVTGGVALPSQVSRVTVSELSEAALKAAFDQITAQFGTVGAFIHLQPVSAANGLFQDQEKSLLKSVFLLAKFLKPGLTQAAQHSRGVFMTVSRLDGRFGSERSVDYGVISGGLFGLTKTVNLEWGSVYCRAVDLAAAFGPAEAAQKVLAELYDPNRLLIEVGVNAQGRVTLAAEQPYLNGAAR